MTEPNPPSASHAWGTFFLVLGAAVLTFAAAAFLFSAFMYYDDEGYVLISLRNFAEHGGLYREVYSQYGPFPYVLHYGLHLLGLPIQHNTGRGITLLAWAGCAWSCAWLVRRQTGSLPAASLTLASVFVYLWVMASEPSHPGGLIALLTAVLASFGYLWLAEGRWNRWAVLVGGIGAALVLTKINVGGFVVLSAVAWMLIHSGTDVVRRWSRVPLVLGVAILPVGLMHRLLDQPWVQTYALVFACSAVAVILAAAASERSRSGAMVPAWSVITGAVVALAVCGVVIARGTTPHDLLNGILLGPLRHPGAFSLNFGWPAASRTGAVLSLLGCGLAWMLRRRGIAAVDPIVAALRVGAAAGFLWCIFRFPASSPDRCLFAGAAQCVWLFTWRLPGEPTSRVSARTWLALLFLGQVLHGFPVAGSQLAWGTFLALPLAAIGGYDAARWLRERLPSGLNAHVRWGSLLLRVGLTGAALLLGVRFAEVAARYGDGSNLRLPGAELLRPPSASTGLYHVLTLNAAIHADVLFSEPGMFSLNLWSGVPTPTHSNVTHWFSLLDAQRQQAIIAALEAHPNACVIVQREHLAFLEKRGFGARGELHDYIAREFSPAFSIDGFDFNIRNGRRISPVLLGELLTSVPGEPRPETGDTVIRLRLVLPRQQKVARIELASPVAARKYVLGPENCHVAVTPTTVTGMPIGARRPAAWPLQLDGAVIMELHFDRTTRPYPISEALITCIGMEGEEVALARLPK